MLMQVNDAAHKYTMRQAFVHMASEGSLKHLFKGNGANCAKVGPEMALKMALNDEIKKLYLFFGTREKKDNFTALEVCRTRAPSLALSCSVSNAVRGILISPLICIIAKA